MGTRLGKYTSNMPKAMLNFGGSSLIERQVAVLKEAGINDIAIATGYKSELIDIDGVSFFHNPDFDTTNMVESLFCTESFWENDLLICYGDIIYDKSLITNFLENKSEFLVAADPNWKDYWRARYDSIDVDLESLEVNSDGQITSMGKDDCLVSEMQSRYVGLILLRSEVVQKMKKIYHENKEAFWDKPWQVSGKPFKQAYMTDMIQALVDSGVVAHSSEHPRGWLEFDTNEDYERMLKLLESNQIKQFIDLD